MNLKGLSSKDKDIIASNEGSSPYELLGHGLSQKAYDRLILENEEKAVEKLKETEQKEDSKLQSKLKVKSVEEKSTGSKIKPVKEKQIIPEIKSTEVKSSKVLGVTVEKSTVDMHKIVKKGGRTRVTQQRVIARDKKTGREFPISAYNARFLDKKQFEILA